MEFVEPIRDKKKIEQIKNTLRWAGKIRDLLLFELWINSALRISDLLSLQVKDLFDENDLPKESFDIIEEKNSKKHKVTITPKVQRTLLDYKSEYKCIMKEKWYFIFFNQKKHPLGIKSINRKMARLLIDTWCHNAWLKWNYGWHTLRKTWWYQARQAWVQIELIQHKLNHSSISVTKRYLWITDDELQKICNELDL